ncbi:MAG TPA: 4'-phosphopantetheinyl transferase superfamily protein [Rhodanobacteraceae bacterium]|nr:4'-phosphopantetheinyl transferase superfamily protein [Rhodanobacteraceae bacterium]
MSEAAVPALDDDTIHVCWLARPRGSGRHALREVLARCLGRRGDLLELQEDAHGKPALAGADEGLRFNWSHCGERAVIALARGLELGIDLERTNRPVSALELARRYFTPGEAEALAALENVERQRAFLALWTAKEAVLKAVGRGLAFGLHRIAFEPGSTPPRLQAMDGDARAASGWQLHRLSPPWPDHLATLAWRGGPRRILNVPAPPMRAGHDPHRLETHP